MTDVSPFKGAELWRSSSAEVCHSQFQICVLESTHQNCKKKKAIQKVSNVPLLDGKDEESRSVRGWGGCLCILVMCY